MSNEISDLASGMGIVVKQRRGSPRFNPTFLGAALTVQAS